LFDPFHLMPQFLEIRQPWQGADRRWLRRGLQALKFALQRAERTRCNCTSLIENLKAKLRQMDDGELQTCASNNVTVQMSKRIARQSKRRDLRKAPPGTSNSTANKIQIEIVMLSLLAGTAQT
jgi:hypothetical protein